MEKTKEFKQMSVQEQMNWLTDFSAWTEEQLPVLCALGDAWEASSIKSLEDGLRLISAFGYCRDFVQKSLLFRDFSRRMGRMQYYVDRIQKEINEGMYVKGAEGDRIALVERIRGRRRGRPTKEEVAERKRMEGEPLFSNDDIFGKEDEQDSPEEKSALQAAIDMALNAGARLHFDQIEWLFTDALRNRTRQVAALRATAAKESNLAKELAMTGAPQSAIAPHSQAAVDYTTRYKAIYDEVDAFLGNLYVLLYGEEPSSQVTYDYGMICRKKGIEFSTLRAILKPYWEKIGSPKQIAEKSVESPENKSEENAGNDAEEAERKAAQQTRLHAIRTYFIRKDTASTPRRVKRMEEMIAELKSYGQPVEEYEVILTKTKEEVEAKQTEKEKSDKRKGEAKDSETNGKEE